MESILVIEHDLAARNALQDLLMLRWPELTIITAENGTRGLHLAHELKPDLILLESELPGMTGFQTAKMLRHLPETRKIPIIAMTSITHIDTLIDNLRNTCNTLLCKPFTGEKLLQTVATYYEPNQLASPVTQLEHQDSLNLRGGSVGP